MMAEGSQRALMRNLQKEQEKERRRIRDRQRRQSMSVEEREKHLARRRRNYQLRRQRAENARLTTTTTSTSFTTKISEYLPLITVSNVNVNVNVNDSCNGTLISAHNSSVGLEIPAHKLAKLPRRLRLNHLKHLARSLDDPVEIPNNHRVSIDLIIKGNETSNSTCVLPKGLRLNRVKRLARSLNSDSGKVMDENRQSRMEVEQNLPIGEFQRQLMSMTSNIPKVDQPYYNVRCENNCRMHLLS